MSPKSEPDEAEVDVKSEGKDSPKGSEQSIKTSGKSAAKRRTKTGCLTCRRRRIKCGEEKPFCKNCMKSKRECAGYVQPLVYKQQQGLAGQEGSSRSSISDGDFQFNDGFGSYTPASHYGSFNPFLSSQDQFSHAQAFQYPPPNPAYESSEISFESLRRHSFQDHNANLLGFRAPSHSYTVGPEPAWPSRTNTLSLSEHPASTHEVLRFSSTMMPSPGAFSESYAGASSNHFAFDATPLHETPRRYSVHGFVQVASLGHKFPTLGAPRDPVHSAEGQEDPYDPEVDDFMEGFEQSVGVQNTGPARNNHQDHRTHLHQDGAVKMLKQATPVSPLLDERNEQLFSHFVNVLAFCMSTFERPALDLWAAPPRTVWSYVLPSAAMSNPALAHAILATSSLHIAKLQQSSESVSLKHFTFAARRVGKLLSLPQRRHDVTTLATVLLLGFYEVLNSDHSRWNLHLAGATKLITEHNLAGLTFRARRTRGRAVQFLASHPNAVSMSQADYMSIGIAPSLLRDDDWDVDQKLIAQLTGIVPKYDAPENITIDGADPFQPMTEAEVTTYKMKMDLWWWFCKQDLFQSMVSGDRLLMPYRQRLQCPPRGRIGVAELFYATFDHLVLLLSRLADFGGKDRHRKQRVIESQGGQWKPPAWLFTGQAPPATVSPSTRRPNETSVHPAQQAQAIPPALRTESMSQRPRAPSANEGRTRQNKPTPSEGMRQEGAPMFGMMPPPPRPPEMHSSFHAMDKSLRNGGTAPSTGGSSPTHRNLDDETSAAREEHASIAEAFDRFHASLGPELQPVPHDGMHPSSPFGSKLQFAGPEIGCIWAQYYVGRILLQRLHPDMPPAAMVAAGVSEHLTRADAQKIGQICAGLLASIPGGNLGEPLSPRFAAALMEISFAILFSAVQYTDMSQRGWVISKLHDIAQMTGWSTSAAVAAACEISWERMGQAGKGPPYVRSLDRNNTDMRVNGCLRRLAPMLAASVVDAEGDHNAELLGYDRGLISKSKSSRVHWAMGLLSVEEDVKKMNIGQE